MAKSNSNGSTGGKANTKIPHSASAAAAGGGGGGGNVNTGGGGHGGKHDRYEVLAASAPHKRKQGPKHHSRSYPRGVGLDFRKLPGLTLGIYIDHHGVEVRPDAPPSELAVAVARHFEGMEVDEEEVISGFLERLEQGTAARTHYWRSTQFYNGKRPSRKRSQLAARPGEQVAAKVTRTDENGSWILASVQRFYPDTDTYDVQDEDDTSKLIRLPWSHVMRLSHGTEGGFVKNSDCMAIFPETTSFYKAKVSKNPIWKWDGQGVPVVKEVIVKFEDDEDGATGKTPNRRVPSRYVIPTPMKYFYDEGDDIDLVPPSSVGSGGSGSNILTSVPVIGGSGLTGGVNESNAK